MENPFKRRHTIEAEEPILSPVEMAANVLRSDLGERAAIVDLGASSAGINLNLTDEKRSALLEDFGSALRTVLHPQETPADDPASQHSG